MFYTELPRQVITLVAGARRLVDLSAYVSASATGVQIYFENGNPGKLEIGACHPAQTTMRVMDTRNRGDTPAFVGMNANKEISLHVETDSVIVYLEGEFGDDVEFLTSDVDKTPVTRQSWEVVNHAETTTATHAIYNVVENINGDVHQTGATHGDSTSTALTDTNTNCWKIVPLNAGFQSRINQNYYSFFLVGFINAGLTSTVDPVVATTTPLDSFVPTSPPSGVPGYAVLDFTGTDTSTLTNGVIQARETGTGTARVKGNRPSGIYSTIVKLDDSGRFDARTTAATSAVSVVGYADAPPDTTPTAYDFTDQVDVATSTAIDSNTITVAGINASTPISATNCTYSIDGGAFTGTAGNVTNGQTVQLRLASSATNSTAIVATVDIGGVTDNWSVTTVEPPDTTPTTFDFTDVSDVTVSTVTLSNTVTVAGINVATDVSVTNCEYSVAGGAFTATAGTISSGQTLQLRLTSSASNTTAVAALVTVGTFTDNWTVTTAAANVSTITSNTDPVIAGSTNNALVVANFAVNINSVLLESGAFTSAATALSGSGNSYTWTAPNVSTYTVDTAGAPYTSTNHSLSVKASDGNTTRTIAVSYNPPAGFVVTEVSSVPLNSEGTFAVNFTNGAVPDTSQVLHPSDITIGSAGGVNTSRTTTANLWYWDATTGIWELFTYTPPVVSGGTDSTPDTFTLIDQTSVPVSSTRTSAAITVSGIDVASPISVTNGTYSINNSAYVSTAGTVENGDAVTVRHTSSANNSTATDTTLTIGGLSDVFTSTTAAVTVATPRISETLESSVGVPVANRACTGYLFSSDRATITDVVSFATDGAGLFSVDAPNASAGVRMIAIVDDSNDTIGAFTTITVV